jgi:hypothetical protein
VEQAADAEHMKLVTALISATVSILVVFVKIGWDFFSKRDERVFKRALEAGKISLEGQVKLFVDVQLKGHDARLRIAADWRIKMLDKMLEAGGDLRVRLNGIFAAINELSREASLRGRGDRTQALVDKCDDAIRKISTVGGFLPPLLIEEARTLLKRFDGIVFDIVTWSNLPSKVERDAACDATDKKIEALAKDMTSTFGCWHEMMWKLQEQQLSVLASADPQRMEKVFTSGTALLFGATTRKDDP